MLKVALLLTSILMTHQKAFAELSLDDVGAAPALYAKNCMHCHGANGNGPIDIVPNLAGQKPLYVIQQLKDFRNGTRPGNYMPRVASKLTDLQIQELAAFLSTLPSTVPGAF